jgi:hypothetical protein
MPPEAGAHGGSCVYLLAFPEPDRRGVEPASRAFPNMTGGRCLCAWGLSNKWQCLSMIAGGKNQGVDCASIGGGDYDFSVDESAK